MPGKEGQYGTYSCTQPHALRRQRAIIGIFTNAGSTMLQPSLKPFPTKVQDNSPGSLWTKTVAVALHFFNFPPFQRDPRRQFVGAFKLKAGVGQEGGGKGFHNKLGRLEKTFSCYTWLDDILFWRQNLAKCSSVIGNHKMRWPSVSSEPQKDLNEFPDMRLAPPITELGSWYEN